MSQAEPVVAQSAPDTPMLTAEPGDAEITLTWENGGVAANKHRMRVHVVPESGADPVHHITDLLAEPLSYTFSELPNGDAVANGTTYEIVLQAGNDDGFSEWSESVQVTAGAPKQPVIIRRLLYAGDYFVALHWTVPNDNGDDVNDYDVRYKHASENSWTDFEHDSDNNSVFI